MTIKQFIARIKKQYGVAAYYSVARKVYVVASEEFRTATEAEEYARFYRASIAAPAV